MGSGAIVQLSLINLGVINIRTCKQMLKFLLNFEIVFIRRQTNFVTHYLARETRFHVSHQLFYDIPQCIHDSIYAYMN